MVDCPQALKAQGRQLRVLLGVFRKQIGGQLQFQKLVIGHVAIQCFDDPVPIAIGMGPRIVISQGLVIGIPSDIEPESAPSLAVVR